MVRVQATRQIYLRYGGRSTFGTGPVDFPSGEAPAPTLSALTLSNSTVSEGIGPGGVVGTINGKTSGSTLTLTDMAGNRFAISGGQIVRGATALDYETATSHSITVRETLAGATNSPRDTVLTITVTNVNEAPSLAALTLSNASIEEGSGPGTVVGAIQNKTSSSSLNLSNNAGNRFAISGGNLVAGSVATDHGSATSHNVTIVETLADSPNSPRSTTLTIAVEEAEPPAFTPDAFDPALSNPNAVLSDSNRTMRNGAGGHETAWSASSYDTGIYYYETTLILLSDLVIASFMAASGTLDKEEAFETPGCAGGLFYAGGGGGAGNTYSNGSSSGDITATLLNGDIACVSVDCTNRRTRFRIMRGATTIVPMTDWLTIGGTGPISIGSHINGAGHTGAGWAVNFGQNTFAYTVPSGEEAGWPYTAPFDNVVLPIVPAANSTGQVSFSANDIIRDRGRCWSPRYFNTSTFQQTEIPDADLDENGNPKTAPHALWLDQNNTGLHLIDFDAYAFFFLEGPPPGVRSGTWDIMFNKSGSVSPYNLENMSYSAATSNSIKLTTIDPTLKQIGGVIISGVTASEGSPLTATCLLEGESSSTGMVSPSWVSTWGSDKFGGTFGWRMMKDMRAEYQGRHLPFVQGPGTSQFAIDLTNNGATHIHASFHWSEIEDHLETKVRAWLEDFRDNAAPGSILGGEVSNEDWNYGTYTGKFCWMATFGVNYRLIDIGLPEGVDATCELYREDPAKPGQDPNSNGGVRLVDVGGVATGETRRTFNPGEWFVCQGTEYQFRVYEVTAASPVASGYQIPKDGDSNFTMRAIYEDVRDATMRYQVKLQDQFGALGTSILGDRFVSILGCQLGQSSTFTAGMVVGQGATANIHRVSPSFYAGSPNAYGSKAWHTLWETDPDGFKDGFFQQWEDDWAQTLSTLQTMRAELLEAFHALGVPYENCPKLGWLYEGGQHFTIEGLWALSAEDQAGLLAAIKECCADPRSAEHEEAMWDDLRTYIGDVCVRFSDVETPFINNGTLQFFGNRSNQLNGAWNDNGADEQRYAGFLAAFA